MTKSATRVAADEVSAPIASPVFTGNVGVGVTPEAHHNTHSCFTSRWKWCVDFVQNSRCEWGNGLSTQCVLLTGAWW